MVFPTDLEYHIWTDHSLMGQTLRHGPGRCSRSPIQLPDAEGAWRQSPRPVRGPGAAAWRDTGRAANPGCGDGNRRTRRQDPNVAERCLRRITGRHTVDHRYVMVVAVQSLRARDTDGACADDGGTHHAIHSLTGASASSSGWVMTSRSTGPSWRTALSRELRRSRGSSILVAIMPKAAASAA